jgi:ABC-type uncharacterized transport system substrate-binding protein
MISRRTFVRVSIGGMLLAPLIGDAQQTGKVARIGFLSPTSTPAGSATRLEAFRQGLRELGWVEGQNIALEHRWTDRGLHELPNLAADLVRLRVDIIVTFGEPAIQAARQATSTIPIVVAAAGDLLGTGLVANLGRPGGNVTGLSFGDLHAFVSKRLELLKDVVPRMARVAFLWNPTDPANAGMFAGAQVAAKALRVTVQSVEVRAPNGLSDAYDAITRSRADALVVTAGPLLFGQRHRITDFAARNHLPAMYDFGEFVEAGGLMSYGASIPDMFRRAAAYVDKILKGARPADLPVEQATRFELVINLKAAKALGLTIPPSLLRRADEVIE